MSDLPQSVRDHIAAGRKIEAIKELRAHTGWGLRKAKEAVEQIERGDAISLRASSSGASASPDELATRIFGLVQSGQTIQAIKEVRDATGADLRTAKQMVDRVAAGQDTPDRLSILDTPLPPPQRSAAPVLAIAIGLLVLIATVVFLALA